MKVRFISSSYSLISVYPTIPSLRATPSGCMFRLPSFDAMSRRRSTTEVHDVSGSVQIPFLLGPQAVMFLCGHFQQKV